MSHIPNVLTILRILLIPVFVLLFTQEIYFLAVIVFLFSISTDFLDGYLAKKYNLITDLGRVLDPLADKLTIISVLLVLVFAEIIPGIIAGIFLFRELFILLGGLLAYLMNIDIIHATRLGKTAIFLLYVAIMSSLFFDALSYKPLFFRYITDILYYIAIPLNIISGVDYFIRAIKHNRKKTGN